MDPERVSQGNEVTSTTCRPIETSSKTEGREQSAVPPQESFGGPQGNSIFRQLMRMDLLKRCGCLA